ncbi:hypothetical protein BDW66DRAFT_125344 [Aspergillus desertorum]
MSDDEEDYYDYDEFDDDGIFWVEEADPTAADDLAATATYDSTLPDDPSLEVAELYSDWEELSDDYYDDDPTAIRRLRAIGAWPIDHPTHINASSSKRRKGAGTLAADSFQGVAWKHPEDEADMVEIYAPGDGEKVSLLKNWREVFRDAKPAIGRLRGRIPSLKTLDVVSSEQSESDLDVPSLVEDNFEDEMVSSDAAEALLGKTLSAPFHSQVTVVDSPSQLPVHPKKGKPKGLNGTLEPTMEDQEAKAIGSTTEPAGQETKEHTTTALRRGRKRKASISVDDQLNQFGNNTGAEAQSRAKRAATTTSSSWNKTSQTAKSTPASSDPVRRSARHKK